MEPKETKEFIKRPYLFFPIIGAIFGLYYLIFNFHFLFPSSNVLSFFFLLGLGAVAGFLPGIVISFTHGFIRKYSSIGILIGFILITILPWLLLSASGDTNLQFMIFLLLAFWILLICFILGLVAGFLKKKISSKK
ncbi:hypothetical protein AUK11_00255 [bacterium CG2_30_37_16]|nr:MAG: hypothetical protein AUK11_00255 [bacterium CG2_30_37_16]PIP30653.1 MAG: hypothetical protein COX25_03620 [bacterium (Candidatus Howlettbacteria) CG23_combo_of_CG06-09_8_20_14_all_37_9]PIX99600.1 MAG: hypothetical protein COZ22_02130 [bacterium (Candidatus Howlettbacteria) CG_4_10_14_3_um_filter_37_10]PJB05397.1 MAG: hypothetical protein CO123_04245 [bacterium (Candidatus Howlettbacteria) CG_4_9_14_3_um_filter_37_10]